MAEFQVTASTLKQKAEELSTLNNNFAKKVEELMASRKIPERNVGRPGKRGI